MIYLVEIAYRLFKFDRGEDAIAFVETAMEHYTPDSEDERPLCAGIHIVKEGDNGESSN